MRADRDAGHAVQVKLEGTSRTPPPVPGTHVPLRASSGGRDPHHTECCELPQLTWTQGNALPATLSPRARAAGGPGLTVTAKAATVT